MAEVQDPLLTRKDLRILFRVDVSTLRRWEQWGLLKPLRLGHRTIRYLRSDVERAIQQSAAH